MEKNPANVLIPELLLGCPRLLLVLAHLLLQMPHLRTPIVNMLISTYMSLICP